MSDQRLRPAPASWFDAPSLVIGLTAEAAAVRTEGPVLRVHRPKSLYKHGQCTVALFTPEADARLAEHRIWGTVTIQPVEGETALNLEP